MKKTIQILTALVLLLLAAGYYLTGVYEETPVDPGWAMEPATDAPPGGAVTVRFSGTSTLLFSDGATRWMTDGWFSRFGPLRLALGTIAPDPRAIERGLAANEVEELDAVIPLHSHFDHAMDAPEVARRTGAVLYGSESTANIARGVGLPEKQIGILEDRQPVAIGDFVVTPIESRHFEFPDAAIRERTLQHADITAPLVPPVSAFDYRVGRVYVLHVAHPRGRFLVVGSAGFEPGGLRGFAADVVFLGVGGLGSQTDQYRDDYWRETVDTVGARRVIPIHYDSLTAPQNGPFRGPVKLVSLLSPGTQNTLAFLRARAAADPALQWQTLPRFKEVVLLPP